jgi:hypothetical protein
MSSEALSRFDASPERMDQATTVKSKSLLTPSSCTAATRDAIEFLGRKAIHRR